VITPLHQSELLRLGYQAVQLITSSSSPLDTLQHLSQNFPSQSSKIAAAQVNESLVDVLRENSRIIPSGENLFWMNGLHIPNHKVEAFNLLSAMRRERGLLNSLKSLSLTNEEAVKFLTHTAIAEKIELDRTNRFDVRDEPEGGQVIIWLNDLEKDSRYKEWSTDLKTVLSLDNVVDSSYLNPCILANYIIFKRMYMRLFLPSTSLERNI
jgi:UDP-glucose:glycoprotein glucosyltransferase